MNDKGRKKLVVLLDGTWNEPGDNTNVWRVKLMLADHDSNGIRQMTYYDEGVGTRWYDRFRGGALGTGLSKNVRQAYQWLMEYYNDGDEVYVFGFSRGAYTARSLTGMIAKCGLLWPGAPLPVLQVFERYRRGQDAMLLWKLEYKHQQKKEGFNPDLEEGWLLKYSKRIPIKFIGVWDTVGALGIPVGRVPGLSRKTLYFHHTRLSNIFEHAYQALAIDEHRKAFRPSLWTKFIPKDDPTSANAPTPNVEQRWFIGAHSNVGGGLRNDPLAQVPLVWIQEKAILAGLEFRQTINLSGDEHLAPVSDSFSEFMAGTYRVLRFGRRFYRTIGWPREEKKKGWVETVNETIDATVLDRWQNDQNYHPPNLEQWAQARVHDLNSLSGVVKA